MSEAGGERVDGPRPARPVPGGSHSLCARCRHVETITSARGSTFLRCGLQRSDPRFPKYPPQPVLSCPGFER